MSETELKVKLSELELKVMKLGSAEELDNVEDPVNTLFEQRVSEKVKLADMS